jgi:basic amino acid/polyamine antiporter, APA family
MTLGDPDRLSDIAIFSVFSFYGFAFYAVFLLRRKSTASNQLYKVPLYPVTPIIAILGTIFIVGSALLNSPLDALISLFITLIGLPIYWKAKSKNQDHALSEAS